MTLVVQSLDAAFAPDRLHFSWIDDPSETRGDGVDRDVKESGAFRLTNTSAEAVTILGAGLDGPFVIDGPALAGRTIPAGGALDVTVLFDRAQFQAPSGSAGAVNGASAVFTGQVRIETSAGTAPPVMLAGTWQPVSEGGYEPNVNEVWEAFGFSNRIEGLSTQNNGGRSVLDTKGSYAVFDDAEVLSPYWRIADGYDSFTVTQLGGFAGPLSGMNIDIHGLGDLGSLKRLWRVAPEDTQMILPDRATGGGAQAPATRSLDAGFIPDAWTGDAIFGFFIGEASSDPTLNTPGSYLRGADGSQWRTFNGGVTAMNEATGQYKPVEDIERIQQGQWIRSYAARDADGNAINHTYLLIYDTPDGNHDYNDVMLLVQGVTVAEYGPVLNVIGLSEGGAGSRLVFSNIENPNVSAATVALGGQVTRDQITLTLENAGEGVLDISGVAVTGPDADVFSASLTTAADGRQQLTVTFSGTDPARDRIAERYEAALVIGSNAIDGGRLEIPLAGLSQNQSELQQEAKVADIAWAFGYATDMGQDQLAVGTGLVRKASPDEVLSPYFEALDAAKPVEVVQLAAFLRQNDVARLSIHGLDSAALTEIYAGDDQQGQTVSPEGLATGPGSTGAVASGAFFSDTPFGFNVAVDDRPAFAAWSDPEINRIDPAFEGFVRPDRGHLIRFFVARDAAGDVIEGTYIGIQDYAGGGNFDYQDHMFLVRNVKPYAIGGVNPALTADADGDGVADFFDLPSEIPTPPAQTAFTTDGLPWLVDAQGVALDAILFDQGGEGVAYHDASAGRLDSSGFRPDTSVEFSRTLESVGYTEAGEWLEYTLFVDQAGLYDLSLLTGTNQNGRSLTASFLRGDAAYETAAFTVESTLSFKTFTESAAQIVALEAGEQVLRIAFDNGGVDLSAISLAALGGVESVPPPVTPPAQTAFTTDGLPWLVDAQGVALDAILFDQGGEGVAYHDASAGRLDSSGFRPDTSVEFSRTLESVGYTEAGEWLEYTLFVDQAGLYDLSLLTGTNQNGRSLTASFLRGDAAYETAAFTVESTLSFKAFTESAAQIVALEAGEQVLRIAFDNGGVDLSAISLTASDTLL